MPLVQGTGGASRELMPGMADNLKDTAKGQQRRHTVTAVVPETGEVPTAVQDAVKRRSSNAWLAVKKEVGKDGSPLAKDGSAIPASPSRNATMTNMLEPPCQL